MTARHYSSSLWTETSPRMAQDVSLALHQPAAVVAMYEHSPPTRAHSGRLDDNIPYANTATPRAPSGGRMRATLWPGGAGTRHTSADAPLNPRGHSDLIDEIAHCAGQFPRRILSTRVPHGAQPAATGHVVRPPRAPAHQNLHRPPPPRTPSRSLASCERILTLRVSARCWIATAQLESRSILRQQCSIGGNRCGQEDKHVHLTERTPAAGVQHLQLESSTSTTKSPSPRTASRHGLTDGCWR